MRNNLKGIVSGGQNRRVPENLNRTKVCYYLISRFRSVLSDCFTRERDIAEHESVQETVALYCDDESLQENEGISRLDCVVRQTELEPWQVRLRLFFAMNIDNKIDL